MSTNTASTTYPKLGLYSIEDQIEWHQGSIKAHQEMLEHLEQERDAQQNSDDNEEIWQIWCLSVET